MYFGHHQKYFNVSLDSSFFKYFPNFKDITLFECLLKKHLFLSRNLIRHGSCSKSKLDSVLSHLNSVQLLVTLWTRVCKPALSMRFSQQEYWSGFLCSPPWELPGTGKEPRPLMSPTLTGTFFTTSTT